MLPIHTQVEPTFSAAIDPCVDHKCEVSGGKCRAATAVVEHRLRCSAAITTAPRDASVQPTFTSITISARVFVTPLAAKKVSDARCNAFFDI